MPTPSRTRTIDGPDQDLLDAHEVAAYLRLSLSTFKRLVRDGHFPRPIEMTPGSGVRVWRWTDCVMWTLLAEARPRMRASRRKTPSEK